MILVSRVLTYIIPSLYGLGALLWLLYPAQTYVTTGGLVLLTALTIYLMLRRNFVLTKFINELIYPVLLLVVGSAFLIFLATDWTYLVAVIFLSVILLFIFNDIFSRLYPALGSSLVFDYSRRLTLSAGLFFLFLSVGYNLILYLNWSFLTVLLGIVVCLTLLFLRLVDWEVNKNFFLTYLVLLVSSLELYFVFYYLASDVYLKALFISLNFLLLVSLVFKNYFNKLEQNYVWKEK